MSSEVSVPQTLHLPEGLAGLPAVHVLEAVAIAGGQFIEPTDPAEPAIGWLAAAADDVSEGMTETLRASGRIGADEVLLVLLSTHGEPAKVTANLAGPLAVAPDGTTRQLILEDPAYALRAPVGRLAPPPIETT